MKMRKMSLCVLMILSMLMTTVMSSTVSAEKVKPKLNRRQLSLDKGDTFRLKLNGAGCKVKWSSSNKKVASVSNKGIVKAKKTGKCTVTAKCSSKKYACSVRVRNMAADAKQIGTSVSGSNQNGSNKQVNGQQATSQPGSTKQGSGQLDAGQPGMSASGALPSVVTPQTAIPYPTAGPVFVTMSPYTPEPVPTPVYAPTTGKVELTAIVLQSGLIELDIINGTEQQIGTGLDFSLEVLQGDTWCQVPFDKNGCFPAIAMMLPANSVNDINTINLNGYFTSLQPGRYRFVKDCYYPKVSLYAEFTLPSAATPSAAPASATPSSPQPVADI